MARTGRARCERTGAADMSPSTRTSGQKTRPAQAANCALVTSMGWLPAASDVYKRQFQIGFMVFIPFLVIDMVVASVLMSMGMMMLSPVLVSLPFKLMLFVMADGWNLLIGSLVASFSP